MKTMRFAYQLMIVSLALAVTVFALSDTLSVSEVELSPSFSTFGSSDKIDPLILEDNAYLSGEDVRVIVSVRDLNGDIPDNDRALNRIVRNIGEDKVAKKFGTYSFVAVLNQKEILKLAKSLNVLKVSSTKPVFKANLNEVIDIVNANDVWEYSVYDESNTLDGRGQSIAIIDHGIDFTHIDFNGKNIVGANVNCFSPQQSCFIDATQTDTHGHGTHVAGIAAAASSATIPGGVAKGANLIGLKVFPDESEFTGPEEITNAIQWAIENRDAYDISVLSLSLGDFERHISLCDSVYPDITAAVNVAVSNGLSVVAATGNEGFTNGINAPACISNVIPVGATNDDDSRWIASNYWSLGNLFAPGVDVVSTCATAHGNGPYCEYDGTSMSTPAVSGALAIAYQVMEATGEPRRLHPKNELYPILMDSGAQINGLDPILHTRIDVNNFIEEFILQEGHGCLIADSENNYLMVC